MSRPASIQVKEDMRARLDLQLAVTEAGSDPEIITKLQKIRQDVATSLEAAKREAATSKDRGTALLEQLETSIKDQGPGDARLSASESAQLDNVPQGGRLLDLERKLRIKNSRRKWTEDIRASNRSRRVSGAQAAVRKLKADTATETTCLTSLHAQLDAPPETSAQLGRHLLSGLIPWKGGAPDQRCT